MSLMDHQAVDQATAIAVAGGVRVFNGALFGDTEAEHIDVLLAILDPSEGAMVIDAGCGIGEMARLMAERRPDLQFLLVNTSAAQLAMCPPEFDQLQADFDDLAGVPDHCADAVIFSFAICHSAFWLTTLAEARRVLKPGGTVLINDMARLAGSNEEFERLLGARVWPPEFVEAWAREAGLMLEDAIAPQVRVDRLRDMLVADGIDAALLDGLVPTVWRFVALNDEAAMWGRHAGRIGFQFSGGRDSTAALYLLRDRWTEMRVYHVDTGDQFPETRAVVDAVERDLAAAGVVLERILTDVAALRATHGFPSDLIPVDNTELGRLVSGETLRLTGRYDCCARALMTPLHHRMLEDGITLLIRGQRDDEYAEPPTRDGEELDGFEVHYPIQSWTGDEVQEYLEKNHLPVAPFYRAGTRRAPECMGCTAWWDEGRSAYMRAHHPAVHAVTLQHFKDIKQAIAKQAAWLNSEMEATHG